MRDAPTDQDFRRTAELAAMRPGFLASVFAHIQRVEELDRTALAHRLGTTPERLDRMALCRRPRQESFRRDLEMIAARFNADIDALAQTIRLADALESFSAGDTAAGLLAAARDADEDHDASEEPKT
jgi:hypothetical protein